MHKWPHVIALILATAKSETMAKAVSSVVQKKFSTLLQHEAVRQHSLVRRQFVVHDILTRILLMGNQSIQSNGKDVVKSKALSKLEKQLKKAMRDFQLCIDIHNDSDVNVLSKVDFKAWFKSSIAEVYATKIPLTIEYLCDRLETSDPWVDFLLKQQRAKLEMQTRLQSGTVDVQMEEQSSESKQASPANDSLSQLLNSNDMKKTSAAAERQSTNRKRKLD